MWPLVNRDGVEAAAAPGSSTNACLMVQHVSCRHGEVDRLCPQEANVLIRPSCLLLGAPGRGWQKCWLTQSDMCLVGRPGFAALRPCFLYNLANTGGEWRIEITGLPVCFTSHSQEELNELLWGTGSRNGFPELPEGRVCSQRVSRSVGI